MNFLVIILQYYKMDEFDLDSDLVMGTSVDTLQLKYNQSIQNTQPLQKNKLYSSRDMFVDKIEKNRPDNNMRKLIDNLERDLDVMTVSDVHIEPEPKIHTIKINNKSDDNISIIIYILLFILLNNKFIIDIIHKYIPYDNNNLPYVNLFIRSIIFGVILLMYKKYYGNN